MLHRIPFAAGDGVGLQHLLVGEQFLLVRFEELPVDLPRLFRSDVPAGETPILMQYLLLKATEHRLDTFRRSVIWCCRAIDAADIREELLSDLAPLPALIVGNDFIRFVSGCFDSHTECPKLSVEILRIADRIAEQGFAVSVDHFVHRCGTHHRFAVLDRLVEEVELRSVTVPQRIAHRRHFGLVAACIELFGRQFTINSVVPQRLDLRPFEVLHQRRLRSEPFPTATFGDAVEFFEELLGRIDRDATTTQGDDLTSGRFGNFQRVRIAELARHEAGIALFRILAELVAQTSFTLGQGVSVGFAQLLGRSEDVRPDDRRIVIARTTHRFLCPPHFPKSIQHPRIQRVFCLFILR